MPPLVLVVAFLFLAVGLDRLLLWCEWRGWIYYRRTPRIRHSAGTALLNIEALLQPSRQHVVELRLQDQLHREEDEEAGGADPAMALRIP